MQEVKIGEELMYDRNDDLKAIIDEVDSAVEVYRREQQQQ